MKQSQTRRESLKTVLSGTLGAVVFSQIGKADACGPATPQQIEGPFYPEKLEDQPIPVSETDLDLTRVKDRQQVARGEIVDLSVWVVDAECRPIAGATVDLWQACATGRYNHSQDPNSAALDPYFQYQGIGKANSAGILKLRTVKPGAYPASTSWTRPPHIHFKVSAKGYVDLTTQMYFEGDALNANDKILQGLSPLQREGVVVSFDRKATGLSSVPVGTFKVVLQKVVLP